MNKVLSFCFAAVLAGSFLSSCKKDNESPNTFNEDQQVSIDQNQADNEAEDVSNLEDQVMDALEVPPQEAECYSFRHDFTSHPKRLRASSLSGNAVQEMDAYVAICSTR